MTAPPDASGAMKLRRRNVRRSGQGTTTWTWLEGALDPCAFTARTRTKWVPDGAGVVNVVEVAYRDAM
jgi:hypothetical protein